MKDFSNYNQTNILIERVSNGEKFDKVIEDYNNDLKEYIKSRSLDFAYGTGVTQANLQSSFELSVNLLIHYKKRLEEEVQKNQNIKF